MLDSSFSTTDFLLGYKSSKSETHSRTAVGTNAPEKGLCLKFLGGQKWGGGGMNLGFFVITGSLISVSLIKKKKKIKLKRHFWTSQISETQYFDHFKVDESETCRVHGP